MRHGGRGLGRGAGNVCGGDRGPRLAAWLDPGSPPQTSSTPTCSAPGGRERAPLQDVRCVVGQHNQYPLARTGPAAPRCARRSVASMSGGARPRRRRDGDQRTAFRSERLSEGCSPVVRTPGHAPLACPCPDRGRITWIGRGLTSSSRRSSCCTNPTATLILSVRRLHPSPGASGPRARPGPALQFSRWIGDPGPYRGATMLSDTLARRGVSGDGDHGLGSRRSRDPNGTSTASRRRSANGVASSWRRGPAGARRGARTHAARHAGAATDPARPRPGVRAGRVAAICNRAYRGPFVTEAAGARQIF